MKRRLYTGPEVQRAQSIEELRAIARKRVPNFCFEYVEGGAEEEISLRHNREVFSRIAFVPRTLVDVSVRSQQRRLFGKDVASPFLIGPTGFSGLLAREGDVAMARAAGQAGVPFVLTNVSTTSLEDVVRRSGAQVWQQVYLYRDRDFVADVARRAQAAGIDTLVLTTDSAVYGKREWDLRNFSSPRQLDWRNKIDVLCHPRWLIDILYPHGFPRFANLGDLLPAGQTSVRGAAAAILGQSLSPALDWRDVEWLRGIWPGNLVLKGVMQAQDAQHAVALGVDGIVLSNHGGRQLDGALSTMDVLPEVVAAVKGQLTVMLDGGFRRGADIVKAIALGADAVLLGRATTYGLAAGGEAGAARALEILRSEVDRVLALLACPDIAQLDASYLRRI
ncbi:alpha-hydroxy-acid oxidizing protein [Herbaspirillum frisingense]|uniref:alpha-hydroxy acid oxidase n=1 Tax=Herbaspirillum frisingense TaxID=92645 RepID=UPI0015FF0844|nr:alpha-hydroxy acid oxidase [Herbaspirillum frisingense]QNB05508.1 alpha-hydroxy-acid oxidizing protein [Herbaspirillum frisingense]